MRKPTDNQIEQSKIARMRRRADAFYASPAGQRQLRICETFSAMWRRQLAELEAQRTLSQVMNGISESFPNTSSEG